MSGQLLLAGDGGPAKCSICGAEAAGPCARCHQPTCGDCSVLTEGGTRVWAVCLRCEKRSGKSLRSGWMVVLGWILLPMLGLALLLVVLGLVAMALR